MAEQLMRKHIEKGKEDLLQQIELQENNYIKNNNSE